MAKQQVTIPVEVRTEMAVEVTAKTKQEALDKALDQIYEENSRVEGLFLDQQEAEIVRIQLFAL